MECRIFHRCKKFTFIIGILAIFKFNNLNANVLAYEYTSQLSLSTVASSSSSIQQNGNLSNSKQKIFHISLMNRASLFPPPCEYEKLLESTKTPGTTITTTTTTQSRQQQRQPYDGITTIPSSDISQSIDTLTKAISLSSASSSSTSSSSSSSSTPGIDHTGSLLTTFEVDAIEKPIDIGSMGHEYIGSSGPNKRESDAIQKALDWLKEKRSADYGWNNDTHMVILAKEVNNLF